MTFSKSEYYELLNNAVDNDSWDLVEYLTRKAPLPKDVAVYRELVSDEPHMENVVIATIPDGYVADRLHWYRGLQEPWYVALPPHYFAWMEGEE